MLIGGLGQARGSCCSQCGPVPSQLQQENFLGSCSGVWLVCRTSFPSVLSFVVTVYHISSGVNGDATL